VRAGLLVALSVLILGLVLWLRHESHAGDHVEPLTPARALAEHAPVELLSASRTAGVDAPTAEASPALSPASRRGPESARALHGTRGTLVLHGRVLDEEGHPLRDWAPALGLLDGRWEARELEADERGRFSFTGLTEGVWRLRVDAVGYRSHVEELTLAEASSPLARELVLVRLPWLVVRVVTPDGEPLARVVRGEPGLGMLRHELVARAMLAQSPVQASRSVGQAFSWALAQHCANSPSSACSANQAEFGSYWRGKMLGAELGDDGIGVLVLEHEPPLFVELLRGAEVLARERVDPGSTEVRFALTSEDLRARSASLHLTARDAATRAPLSGMATFSGPLADPLEWTLDGNGALAAEGLATGSGELRIVSAGHELLRRELTLEPGARLELGELLLQAEARLELAVEDGLGRPLAARFALAPLGLGAPRFHADEFSSDVRGRLVAGALRAGRYLVRTTDEGARAEDGSRWALAPSEVVTGERATLWLVPAAELVLLGTDTLPLRSTFRLAREGLVLFESPLVAGWLPRFALAPGEHRLELFDAHGAEFATRAFTLTPDGLELDLAR
jgi:hypothetical protein